ncbi:MAG TPA: YraN family protein [Candidatus Avalokitesvara rifleensis]|uniref:YraN family protein n=1 Tax=Candidatus Avalokitesvara rifleensis TaxID=3367620 RepID=UPI004026DEA0
MKGDRRALGLEGERVASEFLKKQGYKILQRNYKPGTSEIDIIGYDKGIIAFLEVKTGLSRRYGPPEVRVTETKKRRIYKAAQKYIKERHLSGHQFRFDVVSVLFDPGTNAPEVKLVKDAFCLKA